MTTREKEKKRLTTEKSWQVKQMKAEEKGKHVLDTKSADGTRYDCSGIVLQPPTV